LAEAELETATFVHARTDSIVFCNLFTKRVFTPGTIRDAQVPVFRVSLLDHSLRCRSGRLHYHRISDSL